MKLQTSKKSFIKLAISILISAFFLYITVSKVDFKVTLEAAGKMNYWLIIPAIALHMIVFFIRAIKWKILLDNLKIISIKTIYKIVTIGFMFNNVLPFRLGEIARSHMLGKEAEVSRSGVLGTIFIEKISDAVALVGLISILGVIFSQNKELTSINSLTFILLGVIICVIIIAIFFEERLIKLLENLSERLSHLKPLKNFSIAFLGGLKTINKPNSFIKVGLTSLLIWILEALPYYMISIGFGFDLNFLQILLVCSIVNIGLLIPSSPGYIGTFHFFCVLALKSFGILESIALSYAIVIHIVLWVPITLLGLAIFIFRKRNI